MSLSTGQVTPPVSENVIRLLKLFSLKGAQNNADIRLGKTTHETTQKMLDVWANKSLPAMFSKNDGENDGRNAGENVGGKTQACWQVGG